MLCVGICRQTRSLGRLCCGGRGLVAAAVVGEQCVVCVSLCYLCVGPPPGWHGASWGAPLNKVKSTEIDESIFFVPEKNDKPRVSSQWEVRGCVKVSVCLINTTCDIWWVRNSRTANAGWCFSKSYNTSTWLLLLLILFKTEHKANRKLRTAAELHQL